MKKELEKEFSEPKSNKHISSEEFRKQALEDKDYYLAQGILYDAFDIIGERQKNAAPLDVFKKAVNNVSPVIEVRARRVGGATYQVPTEVRPERRTALAIRWLIFHAKERSDKSMAQKLAAELMAASVGEGGAVKKRDDVHRMAEANKAFAHFRW